MKRFLVWYAVIISISCFASVKVESSTPNMNYCSESTKLGQITFVLQNEMDFQGYWSTAKAIYIELQLKNYNTNEYVYIARGGVANHGWTNVDVDGEDDLDGVYWSPGDVQVFAIRGRSRFYFRVLCGPTGIPDSLHEAWFRLDDETTPLFVDARGNPENTFIVAEITDFLLEDELIDNPYTVNLSLVSQSFDITAYEPIPISVGYVGKCEDTIPPTTPQNLVAVATSNSEIQLSWDASTDSETSVASYQIYRNNSLINSVTYP